MPYYICNRNADEHGRHEIHENECNHLPIPENRIDIGWKSNCQEAIRQMENWNPNGNFKFDGCYWCCRPCHHG